MGHLLGGRVDGVAMGVGAGDDDVAAQQRYLMGGECRCDQEQFGAETVDQSVRRMPRRREPERQTAVADGGLILIARSGVV
jgi:hypothetical protein